MITLSNLAKRFDRDFVLKDINLSIKQGEIVGLLGPNGAGKTTTLRIIAGVLPPTQGKVVISGMDIKTDYQKIKQMLGFLPENNPVYEELTVEEFLVFWMDIKGIKGSKRSQAIDFVVDNCNISSVYYRPISELSKGFKQRVGLSQAIIAKPDILLLDEPTEGLDPNQRIEIQSLIKNLGKKRTVIVSSHVLSEIAKICNRLVIIHKGQIVADDTPEKLRRIKAKTEVVEVEVKGVNVISKLKSLKNVIEINQIKKDYYAISVEGENDIREEIYRTAVNNKWTLLTLVQKERELEDVFSQLTQT